MSKPPNERTPEDLQMIYRLVRVSVYSSINFIDSQENEFFTKSKHIKDRLPELRKHMRIQKYLANDTVVNEGEVGDTFYIVYSGKLTVYKVSQSEVNKEKQLVVSNLFV